MKLLLAGCGNIGGALLKMWVSDKIFDTIIVVQPSLSQANKFSDIAGVHFVADFKKIPSDFKPDLFVLAIKPQTFNIIVPELQKYAGNAVSVSLLSGISIKSLQEAAASENKIVRIMPNVAIKTGLSVNLAYANHNMLPADVSAIETAFASSGKMVWLKQEDLLDVLTPISGSGPAYFFLLTEILAQSALRAGLDSGLAHELAQQVLIGSASMATETTDFESLRQSVTSKGGITEAALKVMIPGFNFVIEESLKKASQKLLELKREDRS